MESLRFVVYGKPQPRGSKTSFPLVDKATGQPRRGPGGRIITVTKDSNKNSGEWMQAIAKVARGAMQAAGLTGLVDGPIELRVTFIVARTAGDFRKNGTVKPGARAFPTVRPDTTKYLRCVEDSLNAVVWRDDSQVVRQFADKLYGDTPGIDVEIRVLDATVAEWCRDGAALPDRNGLGTETDFVLEEPHAA